jgi:hypothetical protein
MNCVNECRYDTSDVKAAETAKEKDEKVVGFAYKASLCPVGSSAPEACRFVHHGDEHDAEAMCSAVIIDSVSTASGEAVGSPWDERSQLSFEYMSKTQHLGVSGQIEDDPATRFQRVALADKDAHRLHREHIQRGSGASIPFESVLLQDPGHERVIINLACKGILNANSLGSTPHDITGDCRLVLTEVTVGTAETRMRRLYFFQVVMARPCPLRRAPPPLTPNATLSLQAGLERRGLCACEYAEREMVHEHSAQTQQWRELRSTVTERIERSDTRTQERKDFSAMSVRQTVSYMDTIHVEEQLVHAFCEQVPPLVSASAVLGGP